jgi:hypothetical protein
MGLVGSWRRLNETKPMRPIGGPVSRRCFKWLAYPKNSYLTGLLAELVAAKLTRGMASVWT